MACIFIPVCIECGNTDNPCRCKIVGPTLGFVGLLVAAVIEWPVGAVVWCFDHKAGSRIMQNPAMVVRPMICPPNDLQLHTLLTASQKISFSFSWGSMRILLGTLMWAQKEAYLAAHDSEVPSHLGIQNAKS